MTEGLRRPAIDRPDGTAPDKEIDVTLWLAVGVAGLLVGSGMWERSIAAHAQRGSFPVGRSWLAGTSVLIPSAVLVVALLSSLAVDRFDASPAAGLLAAMGFLGLVAAAVIVAYRSQAAAFLLAVVVVADLVVVGAVGLLLVRMVRAVVP